MKNDLTQFEKNLIRSINIKNKTNYNHTHFMEWNTEKEIIKKNIRQGELIYKSFGCYVAMKTK